MKAYKIIQRGEKKPKNEKLQPHFLDSNIWEEFLMWLST